MTAITGQVPTVEAVNRYYRPHPKQVEFHTDPAAARWFCTGYGLGKTTAGVIEAYTLATVTHPGHIGIVCAPTYPLLMQAWFTEWRQWIPQAAWTLRQSSTEGAEIRLQVGDSVSRILLRSTSNPVSNEGVNAAWLCFDEAARENNVDSYSVLVSRLRRGVPGRQFAQVLTGAPQGAQHWTAKLFGTKPDETHTGTPYRWRDSTGKYAVIRARTSDNPYLPPGYEAGLRSRPGATAAWIAQYLEAEFMAQAGQIFPSFSEALHVVPAGSLQGRKFAVVGCGADWGWTHPGAMVVVGVDAFGHLYALAEEVHSERIVADVPGGWVPMAADLQKRTGFDRLFGDPSLPGNLRTLALGFKTRNVRVQVYPADNDVAEGIRRIAAGLERVVQMPGRGVFPQPVFTPTTERVAPGRMLYISSACPKLIAAMFKYAHKQTPQGDFSEAVVKRDDDPVDALRYAIMGLTRHA